MVGCDVFVLNKENKVLLIKRSDNGFWALPGGCQNLGETPAAAAARECLEESGYKVKIIELLGQYSSMCYPYANYPWKENEFCHLLFRAEILEGEPTPSEESMAVEWFSESELPPLADGHEVRIRFGYEKLRKPQLASHFE